MALKYNPQSQEVSKKIRKINQLAKDRDRAQEVENKRSNVDMTKHLNALKPELVSIVCLFNDLFQFYSMKCFTCMHVRCVG